VGFSVRKRGRETTATTTSDVGSCCCYRRFIRTIARPINESAPQALSTVVRLSARSGSHPFPSVSQQRRARSQPTQRLTNRRRLSATRAEFREVVSSILSIVSISLFLALHISLSSFFSSLSSLPPPFPSFCLSSFLTIL